MINAKPLTPTREVRARSSAASRRRARGRARSLASPKARPASRRASLGETGLRPRLPEKPSDCTADVAGGGRRTRTGTDSRRSTASQAAIPPRDVTLRHVLHGRGGLLLRLLAFEVETQLAHMCVYRLPGSAGLPEQRERSRAEHLDAELEVVDRKSTRLNSSHRALSRMPSSA